jgi:hypothetical protein
MGCGAFSTEDVLAAGLTIAELESRSFLAILQGRRAAVPS